MVGAGIFWGKQQKDQIDGLVVDRLKRDRAIEPRKDSAKLLETG